MLCPALAELTDAVLLTAEKCSRETIVKHRRSALVFTS